MTKTAIDLMTEYRRDSEAALEPCVSCLIERCEPGERELLLDLLDVYFMEAPSPPYSPVQMRRLRERAAPIVERALNDPAVIAQRDQYEAAWRDKPWLEKRWRRLRFGWTRRRLKVVSWWRRRGPQPWE